MKPSIREALDRLDAEIQTDPGRRALALIETHLAQLEEWLTEFRAEQRILRSQLSEQDEVIRDAMLQAEHLRELLPQ